MGINITVKCASCKGEGSRIIGYEDGEPIYENPCSGCGGDGRTTTSQLDDTLLNEILGNTETIIAKCKKILKKLGEEE